MSDTPGQPAPGPGERPSYGGFEPPSTEDIRGFFGSLFDFSFRSFITGRLITVLYVLAVIGIGLWAVVWLISSFASGEAVLIVLALVGVPIVALLSVIYVRVILELIIVVFRIGEDVRDIARAQQGGSPPA